MFSHRAWHKKRFAENAEYREKVRAAQRRYGLSREEYETLLARQGGACGICKQPVAEPLVVDRSRATGRVRGLLCRRCKAGLVCFEEDPRLLMRAAAYRERAVPDDLS